MRKPIILPELQAPTSRVGIWLVDLGEPVYSGDRLVEIVIDGAIVDVSAPVTGKLVEKSVYADEWLQTGQVLGYIEEE